MGQSKGQSRPFWKMVLAPCLPARGRRIANACGGSPPAPYFLGWLFWIANLLRQAFLESKFEEAGWTANPSKNLLKIP